MGKKGSRLKIKSFLLGVALTLIPLPAFCLDLDQCPLFSDGVQDPEKSDLKVTKIEPVLSTCHSQDGTSDRIAIRKIKVGNDPYLLLVDAASLRSRIERERCWKCAPVNISQIEPTRFGGALLRESRNYKPGAGPVIANAGLKHAENNSSGSFLTADLCPAPHALDRELIEDAVKVSASKQAPLALSASGGWLRHHGEDFVWIKQQVQSGHLDVVWVNHSNKHPFKPGAPNQENFLLTPGVDLPSEILETEKLLISMGVTPSIFFRFPGLISDAAQLEILKKHSLIPLGADAWLATGQKAEPSSIILVHANGNEPLGKKVLEKLIQENRLPLPLHRLTEAPKN